MVPQVAKTICKIQLVKRVHTFETSSYVSSAWYVVSVEIGSPAF